MLEAGDTDVLHHEHRQGRAQDCSKEGGEGRGREGEGREGEGGVMARRMLDPKGQKSNL